MSQKALVVETPKTPFVLKSVPIPKPGPNELLVKVMATGLNMVDRFVQAHDLLPNMKYPLVLGFDAAGSVEGFGEGVQGYTKGDRVYVFYCFISDAGGMYGGFQQYTIVTVDHLTKASLTIPSNISYAEAASLPLTFCTTAIPLMAANPIGAGLNPTFDPKVNFNGESALVIGGSTSVGQYAIQLLKYVGYSEIITYASAKHSEYLKSLGATHIIDRTDVPLSALPDAVKKVTSSPIKLVHVAFVQAPDVMEIGYACLAHGGQMPTAHPLPTKPKDADATGRKIYGVYASTKIDPNIEFGKVMWKNLYKLLEEGVIKPNRVENVPNGLAGITDALLRFDGFSVSGVKLVVNPQETP
ncbi:GroES-like protein [Gymnopus androsaceus JB14]|uniref:GroES-like protein n=1 Tax=Gymnopus androsaceus JB14 TaxID=1447944 RepID=A0A6A4GFB3_9AGAR|nr:GroES-like protein [Gymnopus androsaceus JB14]